MYLLQQEARLERQENRLHNKAVRAALHGNFGRAINLEVSFFLIKICSHIHLQMIIIVFLMLDQLFLLETTFFSSFLLSLEIVKLIIWLGLYFQQVKLSSPSDSPTINQAYHSLPFLIDTK